MRPFLLSGDIADAVRQTALPANIPETPQSVWKTLEEKFGSIGIMVRTRRRVAGRRMQRERPFDSAPCPDG